MRLYLDASVMLPLLIEEPTTPAVHALVSRPGAELLVSDFAGAEVSSGVSRRVRMRELDREGGARALALFDAWREQATLPISVETQDILEADGVVRRFELGLRTPDALHLALARRTAAHLATLDVRLARAARSIGLSVASIPV